MGVYCPLKLRGSAPTKTIADALKTSFATAPLPPLPDQTTADS